MVDVVQLVRASDCGSECRRFESGLPPNKKRKIMQASSSNIRGFFLIKSFEYHDDIPRYILRNHFPENN